MKQIILAQHADANSKGNNNTDFDRLLTLQGLEKAMNTSIRIGEYYNRTGFEPQVISSPASRTLIEAYMIAGILKMSKSDVIVQQVLYQENARLIKGCLNYIKSLNSDCPTIVSHIPTVPILIWVLTRHTLKEIVNENLDTYYSTNSFNVDEYMCSGEINFQKGNAYLLKFDDKKAYFDKVL